MAAAKKPKRLSSHDIDAIFGAFAAANPEPKTELDYTNPFTLLIAVVLSAQATDAGVNKATPALFPEGQEFSVAAFAAWADSVLFQHGVSLVFQPESIAVRFGKLPPEFLKAFVADRSQLFSGGSAARLRSIRKGGRHGGERSRPGCGTAC